MGYPPPSPSSLTRLGLRKAVYPYGYMDDWEKFNETEE